MFNCIRLIFNGIMDDFKTEDLACAIGNCALLGLLLLFIALAFTLIFIMPYTINLYLGLAVSIIFLLPFAVLVYARYIRK